jgi:hypothetical protein
MIVRRMVLAMLLPFVAACRGDGTGPAAGAGSFSAAWVGADSGELNARPSAVFCSDGNHLELYAMRGDVGVGLALFPGEELRVGTYDVFDPGVDSVHRPGVSGAVRWFTERDIPSYQSDWGSLELVKRGTALAGNFAIHMRRVEADTDTIMVTGKFSGVVPVVCPADSVPRPGPAK